MTKHLVPVTIDGRDWWLTLISVEVGWAEGPCDPVFGTVQAGPKEWMRVAVEQLGAVLAALPDAFRAELVWPFAGEAMHAAFEKKLDEKSAEYQRELGDASRECAELRAKLDAARYTTERLAALVGAACRWQEVVGNAQGSASGGNDARLEHDRRLGVLMQEVELGYQALPEHLRPRAFTAAATPVEP